MPSPRSLSRCWLPLWLLVLAIACGASANAQPGLDMASETGLVLLDDHADQEGWPHVSLLTESGTRLTPEQALARLREFKPPTGPYANLGVHPQAVWLSLPVRVPTTESGRWVLDIDYPSLDQVDVYQASEGHIVRHDRLGDHVPYAQRGIPGRTHSMALVLEPGQPHVLLMRVETTSSMIVPLRLIKPQALAEREATIQMLQGLATGIGLCLVVYALAHWLTVRDQNFLYYALSVACITLFFFAYHGLGPQHVWGGSEWLTRNMPPLIVLPALSGGLLFLERTLQVRQMNRWTGYAMLALAGAAAVCALLFMTGMFSYRTAHLAGTILGPTPIVLGLPAAWARARRGDRAAVYIVAGWGLYAVGILVMAALLRGMVDSNAWTQNAFQAGAMAEMVMWMGVLGVRMDETRREAERADRERNALHSLAHTDSLTGLPNRRGLHLELRAALPNASQRNLLALYMLDLDGFKAVNDRLGHAVGDELLKVVASRLRAELRARDVVARLGGDEFVVLAGSLGSDEDARRLGQQLIDAFEAPVALRHQSCKIGLTVGYALAPLDSKEGTRLLTLADGAMYEGKQAGKGVVRRAQVD